MKLPANAKFVILQTDRARENDSLIAIDFDNTAQAAAFMKAVKSETGNAGLAEAEAYFHVMATEFESQLTAAGWTLDMGAFEVHQGLTISGKAAEIYLSRHRAGMLVFIAN